MIETKSGSELTFCFRRRHSKHEIGCALPSVAQLMIAIWMGCCTRAAMKINAKADKEAISCHTSDGLVSRLFESDSDVWYVNGMTLAISG